MSKTTTSILQMNDAYGLSMGSKFEDLNEKQKVPSNPRIVLPPPNHPPSPSGMKVEKLNSLIAEWREPGFVRVLPARVVPWFEPLRPAFVLWP